jgi:hypothetical protein
MAKTRAERRRQRAKTDARRLSRFHRSLEGQVPPKAVVGPAERLWRTGRLSDEQFWAATHFAGCYEATLPISLLRAGSFECSADGATNVLPETVLNRRRLGEEYRRAVVTLRRDQKNPWLATIVLAAAVMKIPIEEIGERLQKRKQWSRDSLVYALSVLADHWGVRIAREREKAEGEGTTLV